MQNAHPLTIHLPLALLTLAALAEVIHRLTRRPLPDVLSRWFLYLGAAGAALSALSGWIAAETVSHVSAAGSTLVTHRNLGFVTLGTAAALASWRWAGTRHGGPRPRGLFTAALVGLLALLFFTGKNGGDLVYVHGVGTTLTAPGGPLAEPDSARAAPRRDVPSARDFR